MHARTCMYVARSKHIGGKHESFQFTFENCFHLLCLSLQFDETSSILGRLLIIRYKYGLIDTEEDYIIAAVCLAI